MPTLSASQTGKPPHPLMNLFSFVALLTISLSSFADQSLPLTVKTSKLVRSSNYTVERLYAGLLESNRSSHLGFQYAGNIKELYFNEGDVVNKGDILATMDSREILASKDLISAQLSTAKANYAVAKSRLDLSSATLRRHLELVKKGHTSAQRLDEVRYEQKMKEAELQVASTSKTQALANLNLINIQIDKTRLTAPFDAVIQQRLMDEGTIVNPGQHVFHLIEKGKLQARVGIPLKIVNKLKKDAVYPFKIGGKTVDGRFCCTLPRTEQSTGTVTAKFDLATNALYAGSLTEMVLKIDVEEQGYWVPIAALSESQRGLWSVLVVSSEKVVETRLIEIIHRGNNQVYVRGTLADGDLLVDGGVSRVVPGQTVKLALIN